MHFLCCCTFIMLCNGWNKATEAQWPLSNSVYWFLGMCWMLQLVSILFVIWLIDWLVERFSQNNHLKKHRKVHTAQFYGSIFTVGIMLSFCDAMYHAVDPSTFYQITIDSYSSFKTLIFMHTCRIKIMIKVPNFIQWLLNTVPLKLPIISHSKTSWNKKCSE